MHLKAFKPVVQNLNWEMWVSFACYTGQNPSKNQLESHRKPLCKSDYRLLWQQRYSRVGPMRNSNAHRQWNASSSVFLSSWCLKHKHSACLLISEFQWFDGINYLTVLQTCLLYVTCSLLNDTSCHYVTGWEKRETLRCLLVEQDM